MVREGIIFVLIPAVVAIILLLFGFWWLAAIFVLIALFVAFFFRDPRRIVPPDEAIVLSAADGRVTRVEQLEPNDPQSPIVVSVFLSIFNVHLNRAPVAGKITDITYTKGKFKIATSDQASAVNEQNALTIKNDKMIVVCKQIAGVVARRIVCWKKVGDQVALGEKFGLIKFGSRTDLILPPSVQILVKVGDRVRGGISVIGRFE